jgi:anti-anti-sigma factor
VKSEESFPIALLAPDTCLVAARGELDAATVWKLQDALGAAGETGATRLVADLAAVTYLDADALSILASCATQIHRHGGTLVVVTDDPWLLRLLAAENLAGIVEVEHSLRDVVERQLLAREVSA